MSEILETLSNVKRLPVTVLSGFLGAGNRLYSIIS